LHACSIEQEIAAESAKHKLVELALNKFVAILFVYLVFTFPKGALSPKSSQGSI
jgi:hypothetical protein